MLDRLLAHLVLTIDEVAQGLSRSCLRLEVHKSAHHSSELLFSHAVVVEQYLFHLNVVEVVYHVVHKSGNLARLHAVPH